METDEHQIPFSRFFVELCLAQCLQFKVQNTQISLPQFEFPNLGNQALDHDLRCFMIPVQLGRPKDTRA